MVNLGIEGIDGLIQVKLYDLSGKVLLQERQSVQSGTVLTYDVSALRSGIYILEATGNNRRSTLRLTVN